MPLEAAVVVLDNSEYSRNGDLLPSRWDSEQEAIELYINVVIDQNMESGMGLILGGGKQVRLLMTPTNDRDMIVGQLHKTRLEGNLRFSVALQQASLALKHRINKQQQQRIVAFVASPIDEDADTLTALAKRLKKNNIAVDLINFGEQNEEHLLKLKLFFDNVQKGTSSKFVNIPPGMNATDVLFKSLSANLGGDFQAEAPQQQGGQQQQQEMGQFLEYGGIDPNLDPELAMVMKLSLEEEQRKQQQTPQPQQQQQQQQEGNIQEEKVANVGIEEEDDEEQKLLEQAKLLSMQEEQNEQEKQQQQQQQQSQQQQQPQPQQQPKPATQGQVFQDQEFLDELLGELEEDEEDKLLKKGDENAKKD